jgi:hypothetical protein
MTTLVEPTPAVNARRRLLRVDCGFLRMMTASRAPIMDR